MQASLFATFEHALEIEETLAIEDHLRECTACAEEARRARLVHEALARLPEAPVDRVDVERNLAVIREAIDRRTAVRPAARRWPILAAAAGFVALALAARFVWVESTDEIVPAPTAVESQPPTDSPQRATPAETLPGPASVATAVVELSPLEPIDAVRLESSRANVRAALVSSLPALESADVAGFVDGVDRSTEVLARSGWPIARLVERFTEDADVGVATGALRWLGRRGDATSLRRLENALAEPERRDAAAAALVDALGDSEPHTLAAILSRSVKSRQRPLDPAFALDLVVREKLEPALPWLEDLARERAQQGDEALAKAALEAVASFESVSALRSLLRMRESPRFEPEIVAPALEMHLARSTRTAVEFARDRSSSRRPEDLRALNEALLDAPRASFVPVWIELSSAKELSRGDRRFAILLAGEHGTAADLEPLTDLLRRFERNERDLKAAVLIALHTIGGKKTLEAVLAATPKEPRARILELFEGAGRDHLPESNLLELARRLQPLIAPLQL